MYDSQEDPVVREPEPNQSHDAMERRWVASTLPEGSFSTEDLNTLYAVKLAMLIEKTDFILDVLSDDRQCWVGETQELLDDALVCCDKGADTFISDARVLNHMGDLLQRYRELACETDGLLDELYSLNTSVSAPSKSSKDATNMSD